MIFIHFILQ